MISFYGYIFITGGVMAGFLIIGGIRHLVMKTCIFRHRSHRFIAMDLNGQPNVQGVMVPRCKCWKESYQSFSDYHRFRMRWFCDSCETMGEHCWDKRGEWKLEMGRIVPDEKRWAQRK